MGDCRPRNAGVHQGEVNQTKTTLRATPTMHGLCNTLAFGAGDLAEPIAAMSHK